MYIITPYDDKRTMNISNETFMLILDMNFFIKIQKGVIGAPGGETTSCKQICGI